MATAHLKHDLPNRGIADFETATAHLKRDLFQVFVLIKHLSHFMYRHKYYFLADTDILHHHLL